MLPPLSLVDERQPLPAKMSPECTTRSAGKTTHASPLVWPRPK